MADNVTYSGSGSTVPANTIQRTDDLGAAGHVPYVKLMDGTDGGTTAGKVTTEGNLQTITPNRTASGTLNALNAAVTITADDVPLVAVRFASGSLVGTVVPEITLDGSTWESGQAWVSQLLIFSWTNPSATSAWIRSGGLHSVRLRVSAYTSGTVGVTLTGGKDNQDFGAVWAWVADATGQNLLPYNEADTDAAISGIAILWEDAADTLRAVSAAKPLPIGDAGGSLTVDNGGTFAVQDATAQASLSVMDDWDETDRAKVNLIVGQAGVQGGAGTSTALTQRVAIATDANAISGTVAVTGVSTLAEQQTQTTALQLLDDAVYGSDAVLAKSLAIGAVLDDVATVAITENQAGYVRMSSARRLLVDGSGVTQPVSAASLPLPTGAATAALQLPAGHAVDTELMAAAALADAASAAPTTSTVGAVGLVMNATTADRQRAVVNALDSVGTGIAAAGLVGQFDDAAPSTVTENQFAAVRISSARRLLTDGSGVTQPVSLTSTTITGTVTVDSELPAAAAISADNIAAPTTSSIYTFPLMFDGTNWDRLPGTSVDGVTVNLGANNDVIQPTASLLNAQVVGNVAHDAAASGNPVMTAGSHETPADSAPANRLASVTDGDVQRFSTVDGALFIVPGGPQQWKARLTGLIAADTTVKASPGAGLSLYITSIVFSIGAATASSIMLEESTTTPVFGPHYLEAIAGRGMAVTFGTPIKIAAATLLSATGTGSTTATLDVYGFTAPG